MKTDKITYKDGTELLEGYCAYEETLPFSQKPAVLIVHDWSGLNRFACEQAENLARLGYVGFAVDMYGKGILGANNEEKALLMAPLLANRAHLQQRMITALTTVQQLPMVDHRKIAVLGFCFGGLCALDLARSGKNIVATISMHGLLHPPVFSPNHIPGKILVLHGYDDPMVSPQEIMNFAEEMTKAKADWQIHIYGHTKHAFTNPLANDDHLGTVYNALAKQRAWQALEKFLEEAFTC